MVWIVASAAFALYVANFGSYNKTYGTLGGIVTLLVWLWITNMALLFGAELNSERERSRELADGVPGPSGRSSSSLATSPTRAGSSPIRGAPRRSPGHPPPADDPDPG